MEAASVDAESAKRPAPKAGRENIIEIGAL
jgi:hypothetical protein